MEIARRGRLCRTLEGAESFAFESRRQFLQTLAPVKLCGKAGAGVYLWKQNHGPYWGDPQRQAEIWRLHAGGSVLKEQRRSGCRTSEISSPQKIGAEYAFERQLRAGRA